MSGEKCAESEGKWLIKRAFDAIFANKLLKGKQKFLLRKVLVQNLHVYYRIKDKDNDN